MRAAGAPRAVSTQTDSPIMSAQRGPWISSTRRSMAKPLLAGVSRSGWAAEAVRVMADHAPGPAVHSPRERAAVPAPAPQLSCIVRSFGACTSKPLVAVGESGSRSDAALMRSTEKLVQPFRLRNAGPIPPKCSPSEQTALNTAHRLGRVPTRKAAVRAWWWETRPPPRTLASSRYRRSGSCRWLGCRVRGRWCSA